MKVLIVEDEAVSRCFLQAFLHKWGYEVVVAVDGRECLRALAQPDSPRLVIMDRMMPNMDGVEACRAIRAGASEPYIYVILLTGNGQQSEIIEGFEAGADDYITKPFEAQELRARVRTGARIVELQEQLIAAREQLRVEATHDALTGLLNRGAFFDILRKDIAIAERQGMPLALIIGDIDHFKDVNDRYGHLVGDAVLCEAARRLQGPMRASDSIGRYGGEEFVIVAPGCLVEDATTLAERARAAICTEPIVVSGHSIAMSMSFGVAGTSDATQAGQLFRIADEALYLAKNTGRNKVEVGAFQPVGVSEHVVH